MRCAPLSLLLFLVLVLGACSSANSDNAHTTATTIITPSPTQVLTFVPRPQEIIDIMEDHAVADDGKPVVKILSPAMDAVVDGPNVVVQLSVGWNVGGKLEYRITEMSGPHAVVDREAGYAEGKVAVILDGDLCQAVADPMNPLELRNLPPGKHTLHAFVLKSSQESYKNEAALQSVSFTATGNGYIPPAANKERNARLTAFNQCLAPPAGSGSLDPTKPLLLYNRPLERSSTGPIMIDFWLVNAKLKGDGGDYRIRLFVDDDDAKYIDKWEPVWLMGWTPGKHTVRLELLGADQYPVKNGDYNIATREITIDR